MATVWQSWTWMLNYKPSPIQRHQNRFCTPTPSWRNRAHNLWHSKAWRTDRQTKTQRFGRPGRGWNPKPTKLGMVIEDLAHVHAPQKLLGVWRIVLPPGGAENLGITRPCCLKINPWANPTKFQQLSHTETGYKLCKFGENCSRDMPLRGVYIPHFDQISVIHFSFGVLIPLLLHRWGWHFAWRKSVQAIVICRRSPTNKGKGKERSVFI